MNQNLMQRLRELKAHMLSNTRYYSETEIQGNLRSTAKDIISRQLGRDWQSLQRNRFHSMCGYELLERKRMYQVSGREFAQAIQADDWESALQALNQYGTRISHRTDMVEVLQKHFRGYQFFCCEDCNNYFEWESGRHTYDGDYRVCDSCIEDNYSYSHSRDTYISNEDYEDEQDEDEDEPEFEHIGSYHSSKRNLGHIPSSYDMRTPRVLLGLELEIEVSDDYCKDSKAGELIDAMSDYRDEDNIRHTYCLMEEDGSLDHGFEMVTAYTGLDVHKAQLQYFKQKSKGLTSHNTSTCGLHVHVCKSSMTTLHGAKLVLFINDPANSKLVRDIARRDDSSYSRIKNKQDDKSWLKDSFHSSSDRSAQLQRLNADRYEALNFKNEKTIEFRLFKGTLKYETMIACLEFSFASWHFTASASASELTTSKFLEFICMPENRKDTRFLRAYLKEKGYALADNFRKALAVSAPVAETI